METIYEETDENNNYSLSTQAITSRAESNYSTLRQRFTITEYEYERVQNSYDQTQADLLVHINEIEQNIQNEKNSSERISNCIHGVLRYLLVTDQHIKRLNDTFNLIDNLNANTDVCFDLIEENTRAIFDRVENLFLDIKSKLLEINQEINQQRLLHLKHQQKKYQNTNDMTSYVQFYQKLNELEVNVLKNSDELKQLKERCDENFYLKSIEIDRLKAERDILMRSTESVDTQHRRIRTDSLAPSIEIVSHEGDGEKNCFKKMLLKSFCC